MSDKIHSYAELRELIRVSLRIQNPEWVGPNGDSPVCDSYEARFAETIGLIDRLQAGEIGDSKYVVSPQWGTRSQPEAEPHKR
jgi:hypothetical protein